MVPFINRYKWVVPFLVLAAVLVVFNRPILSWLSSGSGNPQGNIPTPTATLPFHPEYVEFRPDTPPFFTFGHQAALKMAALLDASVQFGSNGIVFHCSYISSRSYFDQCASFVIQAVSPLPASPPPPHYTGDAFKDAKLRSDYQKALASWGNAVKVVQAQLDMIRARAHQEIAQLAAMKFPFDDKASDPASGISLASVHFQGVSGKKVLILASTMIQNVPLQNAGTINLQGVDVKLIYYDCILPTAAACQANLAFWDHFLKVNAHAKSFQAYDVEQSDALQTLF